MDKKFTKVQELAYELSIENAMTKNVVTICSKDRMVQLRDIMKTRRISGVPVVDNGKLVGIVSIENFIKCLADGDMDALVGEKMIKDIVPLYADESLIYAVSRFDKYGFGRFPIIDRDTGKLVGIITKSDIIKTLLKELEVDYHEEEIHRYRASHIFEDIISDKTTIILKYDIHGQDFKRAGESSSGLKKSLSRLGVHPQILRRVAIASYEAEMNIVIYTSGGNITVYVKSNKIRIEATDSGPGIPDVEQAMQPGFSTATPEIQELGFGAGMGLPNIDKCADKMKIDSVVGKGTRLEVVIYTQEEK